MVRALALNDVVESKMFSRYLDQDAVNVRHYRVSVVGPSPPTDEDAAAAIVQGVTPSMRAILNVTADFRGVVLQIIRPVKYDHVISLVSVGDGLATGDPLPPQVCGVITFGNGVAGRGNRGRIYVPFGVEEFSAAGLPNALYIGLLDTLGAELIDTVTVDVDGRTATLVPVLYNRVSFAVKDITTRRSRNYFGTQRRRSFAGRGDALGPIG